MYYVLKMLCGVIGRTNFLVLFVAMMELIRVLTHKVFYKKLGCSIIRMMFNVSCILIIASVYSETKS